MALLALDLGTKTGFALAQDANIIYGVQNFSVRRFEGGGMRYLRFERWLDEIKATCDIEEVVFEEVRRHKATDAAHVYGGLLGALSAWCEKHEIPYEGVPVQHIKKYATGKGNSNKAGVINAVRSWGFNPQDDNDADALALLHFRMSDILN